MPAPNLDPEALIRAADLLADDPGPEAMELLASLLAQAAGKPFSDPSTLILAWASSLLGPTGLRRHRHSLSGLYPRSAWALTLLASMEEAVNHRLEAQKDEWDQILRESLSS